MSFMFELFLFFIQTKSDDEHKKAKASKFAEDEEVLRVPIALALVKLMQGLPHKTLDFNLPGWDT